jgi:hypothetical protein
MLYPFQMSYFVHMNDKRFVLTPGCVISLKDSKEKYTLVSFDVDENDLVCMTTVKELTYMSAGNITSASAGDKITFPLDHVMVLCTASPLTPRIEVRVVKEDAPGDATPSHEPTPRDVTPSLEPYVRGTTLPCVDVTPPPEVRVRRTTTPYVAMVIAPPPPQPQKPQKRQKPQKPQKRGDFYMVA